MIKEEAIEILSDMRAEYNIFSDDEEEATRYHALSWAIQAINEKQRWCPLQNVVRCKDCKHWFESKPFNLCIIHECEATGAEEFCSFGERRTDGE